MDAQVRIEAKAPAFNVLIAGEVVESVTLGSHEVAAVAESREVLEESQFYGFEIVPRERSAQYAIRIGDLPVVEDDRVGAAASPGGVVAGRALGRSVLWEDAPHFESCRGLVRIAVLSREKSTEAWARRAELRAYVNPTKLNDARYQAMFEQLRMLAAGLVLDLLSKTLRSLVPGRAPAVSARSGQAELAAIENVWIRIAAGLSRVSAEPIRRLAVRHELRNVWGTERVAPRSLADMVVRGLDPRDRRVPRPLVATTQVVRETSDTPEHRTIAGILDFLDARVAACVASIHAHIRAIEEDRPYRDRGSLGTAGGVSLYVAHDLPRIAQLRSAADVAGALRAQIHSGRTAALLRNLPGDRRLLNSPVFRHVEPYRAIRHAIVDYLNTSFIVLDDGAQVRVKATHRLYEQWLFLQLASAFHSVGLQCEGANLVRRKTRLRFTLDIDRGTRVEFRDRAGRVILMRYEPWIFNETVARQRKETIYQGRSGDRAWSPDVLIELIEPAQGGDLLPRALHAIVVDAKYTSQIQDRHWDATEKYLQLRSTRDGRQVVRQLWLGFPGQAGPEIAFRDESVTWTASGPDRPPSEVLLGYLAVPPPETAVSTPNKGWIRDVSPTLIRFARGLTNYFGLEPTR